MQQERRTTKRDRFVNKPDGLFLLAVSSDQHDVLDVIDVSVTGIGLEMGICMDPGRMVRVIHKDGDTTMYITGMVTHCEEASQRRCRAGIVFDFPHREESNLFYKRVKTFLDS
jgi:hypothetical protein